MDSRSSVTGPRDRGQYIHILLFHRDGRGIPALNAWAEKWHTSFLDAVIRTQPDCEGKCRGVRWYLLSAGSAGVSHPDLQTQPLHTAELTWSPSCRGPLGEFWLVLKLYSSLPSSSPLPSLTANPEHASSWMRLHSGVTRGVRVVSSGCQTRRSPSQ